MKVHLKIKEGNTVETAPHEVEEINLIQVTRAIKVVRDVLKLAKEDEDLKALLEEVFKEQDAQTEVDEDGSELIDNRFVQKIFGAMDVLLTEAPDKAFELLSVLSGVDRDVFMQQNFETAMEIYDAILEENDINKLINRAKKSLALTKSQVKVMNLFPKVKQTEQKQA